MNKKALKAEVKRLDGLLSDVWRSLNEAGVPSTTTTTKGRAVLHNGALCIEPLETRSLSLTERVDLLAQSRRVQPPVYNEKFDQLEAAANRVFRLLDVVTKGPHDDDDDRHASLISGLALLFDHWMMSHKTKDMWFDEIEKRVNFLLVRADIETRSTGDAPPSRRSSLVNGLTELINISDDVAAKHCSNMIRRAHDVLTAAGVPSQEALSAGVSKQLLLLVRLDSLIDEMKALKAFKGSDGSEFAAGDLAQVVTGGPVMTVGRVIDGDGHLPVMWFDANQCLHAALLPVELMKKVDPNQLLSRAVD